VTGIRKDGSMFAIDLAVSEVDHMGLFTGILRDISRRKELEKQVLAISAQEQRRIGQELHDVTGQELTGLTLVAGTLALMLKEKPHKYDESEPGFLLSETELQQLRQMAERLTNGLTEANQHVQQLSHGIMPVQVEPSGLRAALQELCFISNLSPKLSCTCEIPESIEVANNTTATQLYRIAQEAVNNALRHSFADQLHISLHQENGLTILEVTDNGIGIKSSRDKAKDSKRRPDGFGLGIMSYRASMIGGELHVGPREPTGTCVRCVVRREPGIAPSADEPAA